MTLTHYVQLHASAQAWADFLITQAKNEHSVSKSYDGKFKDKYGENLYKYWKTGGDPIDSSTAVKKGIDAWYNEIKDYDFGKPTGFSMKTGHFTQ